MIVKTRYCDRCGQEMPDNEFKNKRVGDIVLHRMNADKTYSPLDICKDCYNEVFSWFCEMNTEAMDELIDERDY